MAVLAILQADARLAARLSSALSSGHRVTVCATWDALRADLEQATFDGCLVDADDPNRGTAMDHIAGLRARWPGLAIVAYADVGEGHGYFDLGEAGVDGVLPSRTPQQGTVRSVVDGALATARADRISRALRGRYPDPAPDAIGWAVENAGTDTNVEQLAAALGHTPRSLRHALEDAGFPGPTRVLLWGRLLLAGARLNRDGRTVEDVAFSLGYSTAASLARAMKRQTGLTPTEVSERGGMDRVREVLFPERSRKPPGGVGKIASLAVTALFASGCATFGLGGGVDRGAIDGLVEAESADRVHWGILAVDAASGRTVYERQSHRWFVPASNQKILISAAAWSLLGPEYRFRTEVWATGHFDPGHMDGDLVVVASGDPSLSARYWATHDEALGALADSLRTRGPGHVTGSLLVDASVWDSTSIGPTREVADLGYGYAATAGVFAIGEGAFEVVVEAGPGVGSPANVTWSPTFSTDFVHAEVATVAADSSARIEPRYLPESRRLELSGTVALGEVDTVTVAQRDPVRLATAELWERMASAGVITEGGWDVRWTPGEAIGPCFAGSVPQCQGARLVATLESPPLAELVAGVLGPSQNWMAEQLTLALGAELGEGGSWDEGVGVVERFLIEDVGVDSTDVRARDGSGLSAYNLITPRAIVRVLQYMNARPDAPLWRSAMAEPAELESTLEERLLDLEGRVFAKTGSISNVNSLSGYLVGSDGRHVIFSILSNGSGLPAERMRDIIDDVVRVLAR